MKKRSPAATALLLLAWALTARAGELPKSLAALPPGSIAPAIPALSDPTQTWDLYLPQGFNAGKRWPVLILFDPRARGRVAAELFREAADEFGWMLASSNNTMSDGPAETNQRAINAMIPDVMKRLPVDERRIYAGGFSGGGVLAWTVGLKGGYLAGVISICGRPAPEHGALVPKFALFSATGDRDFNYRPAIELDGIAAKAGVPHRLEFFPGPHSWCPPQMARQAVAWLELQAARSGKAELKPEKLEQLLAADLEAAHRLKEAGDLLAAARRYRAIVESFRGIHEGSGLALAQKMASELDASPAVKAAIKEEKAAALFEDQGSRRVGEALGLLRDAEIPPPAAQLRQALGVDEVRRRLTAGGVLGGAAARVLETIHVQLSFYLTRKLFAAGEYRKAVPVLQVATETFPDDAAAWYNLACAPARSGAPGSALTALGTALDHGLPQPLQMETDADLAALRGRPEFSQLLERARKAD